MIERSGRSTNAARRARRAGGIVRKRLRAATKSPRRELRRLPKRWNRLRRRVRRVYHMRYRFTYRTSLAHVPAREEISVLLNKRGLVGRGTEIGVKAGNYSDIVLSAWKGRKLISIDPWLEAPAEEYVDRSNVPQERQEELFRLAQERLARHGDRSEIWRLTSVEAARRVPDGSLDFVYIDARHDYDSVLEDLNAWFGKVRPGGLLAGHDYVDGEFPQGVFGVKRAVDEFFGARGIPVHSTPGKPPRLFASWLVEIPRG